MANFNKIILLGNLTRDPQLSYLPSNTAAVELGLAESHRWTGQDGTAREDTCFIDCRAFGRLAENLNKFCRKGNPLFVEGRLALDTWTGQDGSKHSKHRVIIQSFQLLGTPNHNKTGGYDLPTDETSASPDENAGGKLPL